MSDFSEFSVPVSTEIFGRNPGFVADIGHVYVTMVYGVQNAREESRTNNRNSAPPAEVTLKYLRIPRPELTGYNIRKLLMKWSRETGDPNQPITLTGSRCAEYFKRLEKEFPQGSRTHDTRRCAVAAFHAGATHLSVDKFLHEVPKEAIVFANKMSHAYKEVMDKMMSLGESTAVPPTYSGPETVKFPCLLVVVGATTEFIQVEEDGTFRLVDTDQLGEATFMGMAALTSGETDMGKFIGLSMTADGRTVDTFTDEAMDRTSSDDHYGLFPDGQPLFPFGKAAVSDHETTAQMKAGDFSYSIQNVFNRGLGLIAIKVAMIFRLPQIFVSGHMADHPGTRFGLAVTMQLMNSMVPQAMRFEFGFMKHGGYSRALGALLLNQKSKK